MEAKSKIAFQVLQLFLSGETLSRWKRERQVTKTHGTLNVTAVLCAIIIWASTMIADAT